MVLFSLTVAGKGQEPEARLLNKSSRLAPALGVPKFIIVSYIVCSHFVVLLKLDLDVQQTHLSPNGGGGGRDIFFTSDKGMGLI